MPRNTFGGNKAKRSKKVVTDGEDKKKPIRRAIKNVEMYAIVEGGLGDGRVKLSCMDDKQRQGLIPGKFYKKVWFNKGDYVLIELNSLGSDKEGMIVHKYNGDEVRVLKRNGVFKFAQDKDESKNFHDDEFDDLDDNDDNEELYVKEQRRIKSIEEIDLPNEDDEDDEEDDDDDDSESSSSEEEPKKNSKFLKKKN